MSEPQAIDRICRDCWQPFTISVEEQAFFERLAATTAPERGETWEWPQRCLSCRRLRRQARLAVVEAAATDEWRTCVDCGVAFVFGGRDREYFARSGYAPPKRCRPCRRQRQARPPVVYTRSKERDP